MEKAITFKTKYYGYELSNHKVYWFLDESGKMLNDGYQVPMNYAIKKALDTSLYGASMEIAWGMRNKLLGNEITIGDKCLEELNEDIAEFILLIANAKGIQDLIR